MNDTEHDVHYYAFRDAERVAEEEKANLWDRRRKGIGPTGIERLMYRGGRSSIRVIWA